MKNQSAVFRVRKAFLNGAIELLDFAVAEDCGTMVNPMIVEGQIRGGVAQGIGIALYENALYDEDANFLAGTFMHYLVPTAMELAPNDADRAVLRTYAAKFAMARPLAVVTEAADRVAALQAAFAATMSDVGADTGSGGTDR